MGGREEERKVGEEMRQDLNLGKEGESTELLALWIYVAQLSLPLVLRFLPVAAKCPGKE